MSVNLNEAPEALPLPDLGSVADVRRLSKTAQVQMCGNSICPPLAKAVIEANVGCMSRLVAA